MGLKLIGAGLGRTGTESLKMALEHLGYAKCYHMFELMKHGEMVTEWEKFRNGSSPDYAILFKDYQSTVDFPAAIYYREFMQQYPDAKVILTVRNADKWYDSAKKTIFKGMPKLLYYAFKFIGNFNRKGRLMLQAFDYAQEVVHKEFFHDRIKDREYCKHIFNEWNEEVKRTVPADRLLVFEVREGWEPLCKFLDVPVPDMPFPKSNDSDNFQKNIRGRIKENLSSESTRKN